MATGSKIAELAKQFEEGKLHNATGTHISVDTAADAVLANHNNNRSDFHFVGFKAKVEVKGGNSATDKAKSEAASLALAVRLQRGEGVSEKCFSEEEATMRLIKQMQDEEATMLLIAQLQAEEEGFQGHRFGY